MKNKEFIDYITGVSEDLNTIEIITANRKYNILKSDFESNDGKYIITASIFSDGTNRLNINYFGEELPGRQHQGSIYIEVINSKVVFVNLEK